MLFVTHPFNILKFHSITLLIAGYPVRASYRDQDGARVRSHWSNDTLMTAAAAILFNWTAQSVLTSSPAAAAAHTFTRGLLTRH